MRPLGLLFLTRTAPPAKLLFQETERLFNLLAMGIMGFDFTDRESEVGCSPVPAPVFDDHHWRCDPSEFALRVAIAMGPDGPQDLLTKLAVPLEPPHIAPPPPI